MSPCKSELFPLSPADIKLFLAIDFLRLPVELKLGMVVPNMKPDFLLLALVCGVIDGLIVFQEPPLSCI